MHVSEFLAMKLTVNAFTEGELLILLISSLAAFCLLSTEINNEFIPRMFNSPFSRCSLHYQAPVYLHISESSKLKLTVNSLHEWIVINCIGIISIVSRSR
jgi:hypothetical protein